MIAILAVALLGNPPIGEQVVAFARAQLGQQVGDGECSTLAAEALRHAGARRSARGVWGEELPSVKEVRPGDIIQFERAVFVRTRDQTDGSTITWTMQYPHHTAIVASVRKRGKRPVFVVLHQNASAEGDAKDLEMRKVVQERVVNMAEFRSGTLKAYRPVAE